MSINTIMNKGLTTKQAQNILNEVGPNKIEIKKQNTIFKMILEQFSSILIIILIVAAIIFFLIGESIDAIVIFAIVIVNAVIGFLQEYKAEKAVDALKNMLVVKTVVIRDGIEQEINIESLVPGDVVQLAEGDRIPADLKLLESYSLKIDESILTGESVTVKKQINGTEKQNKLFSGTLVVSGKGYGLVEKTGINTEFGKIVNLMSEEEKEKSVFDIQLDNLSKKIVYFLIICIVILFIIGLFRGYTLLNLFLVSVSLAIAAIPEGLPIVVTLTLALGVQVMSKKNSIVRKMSAIESLGSTTVICSDKTGTLTLNEMTVKKIFTLSQSKDVSGVGYSSKILEKEENTDIQKLLLVANNCNDAVINNDDTVIGDPTEIALKVVSKKLDYNKEYELVDEIPFTSERKMMSTINKIDNNYEMLTKGAFEEIIKKTNKILDNGKVRTITRKDIDILKQNNYDYATNALRVLAFAYKPINDINNTNEKEETDLIFIGLCGMIDPPRKDVKSALELSRKAGIETKIITGDNSITAEAIAKDIGFTTVSVVNAKELDSLDDKQATDLIYRTNIFARAKPEHKFRIVNLLQANDEVVAVTGDGVNDAPAIKTADIGIAMGIKGTEATKEAADIVLKDDNFSSIIEAIKQGRRIYDNILLFVKYMLAVNFDLLLIVGLLAVFDLPLPLLALQILWINMVTDSLPAIALGRRKAQKDIMNRPPRHKGESIFNKFIIFITVALVVKITGELLLFNYGLGLDRLMNIDTFNLAVNSYARTMILTSIVVFELFFAFVCNAEGKFNLKELFSNKYLNYSVLIVLVLHLGALYIPFMQHIFGTVAIGLKEWGMLILFGLSSLIVIPITNFIKNIINKIKKK